LPISYGMSAVLSEFQTRVITDIRKPVLIQVEASWENPDGTLQTVRARMEDTSVGGACIRVKAPLVVGTKLKVQWRHEHFSGTVRHCRRDGMEYLAGIQRDAIESPIPSRPRPNVIPPRQSASRSSPPAPGVQVPTAKNPTANDPTVEAQSPPKPQPSPPHEVPLVEQKPESDSLVSIANSTTMPARAVGDEIDAADGPRSRSPALDALLRSEPPAELPVEPPTELQTKEPPKQAGGGRKRMRDKWLELPWRKKQEGPSASGPENGTASGKGSSEKENPMHDLTQPTPKIPARSAREVPTFQVDLSPVEDIYRAAGIMDPRRGYSINKVVEMLHSQYIRNLSKEMKRAALLMALEAAGVTIDQLQRDAKARQDALDSHEALQRKHVEAEWARKAEEIAQIQAELESIKAHYMARISQNMEAVAREKETFANWLTLKQQESQSMAEAVELCLKAPDAEPACVPANVSTSDVGTKIVQASAKTV